ncbi:MAG: tripartite tricarboxylate transporter substrate-binding protein [Acetobacteraceae bacterium]|nr:tripartite tricarboxylate transporter substrate-binding protein [Acetobacteraceae bacterium]
MIRRRSLAALAAALAAAPAAAQPRGNVWLVLGFPPGGLGDIVSRPLTERLRGRYGTAILMDHRVGAGGRLAAEHVRRAAPDGSVILQVPGSVMTVYPHIYRSLRYDPLADFAPAVALCGYTYSLTAGPGLPASVRSLADLLAWARAHPDRASYGVPSAGSPMHFAGMMLSRASGVPLSAVPYRGGAPLLQDLLGGQVPFSFNVLTEVLPMVREGRLRSLAVLSATRSPHLPEVPSLAEQGFPGIALEDRLGWYLPAATPPAVVEALNAAVREALRAPDYRDILARNGLSEVDLPAAGFAALLRAEHARWGEIVRETGFTPDE